MTKLGSMVQDSATGLEGMVSLLQIEMNGNRYFHFEPRGLDSETGKPVKGLWLVETRLSGGEKIAEPDLPVHILGTEVEDIGSGFSGVAVSLCLHINGCVHFNVQPKGKLQKSGAPVAECNFDIRRLKGAAIKTLSSDELAESRQARPSPEPVEAYRPSVV